MPPITNYNELDLPAGEDARKVIIENLNLSDNNKARVKRYYDLSIQPTISDVDTAQIALIWEHATDDTQLAEVLGWLDDMHPPCLAGEELLADNQGFRMHLSDCLPLMAEDKLKRQKGELEEFEIHEDGDSDTLAKTLLCPDGSGAFNIRVPKSHLVGINPDEKCPRCSRKLGEHRQVDVSSELSHACG